MTGRGEIETEVVVIGGGFAGLSAARQLQRSGHSVVLLEARPDVGGRVQNRSMAGGVTVDAGAQFVTEKQDRMIALAKEVGADLVPGYLPFPGEASPQAPEPAHAAALEDVVRRLEELADRVDPAAPWAAPEAEALDKVSMSEWLATNADPSSRFVIELWIDGYFATPAATVSLLHFLFYGRANGGVGYLIGPEADPRNQLRVQGGSYRLALGLREALGEAVHVDEPVTAIRYEGDDVRVEGRTVRLRARLAIVAMPPQATQRIRFEPLLPAQREQLAQRVVFGSGYKRFVVYDSPFWRDDPKSIEALRTHAIVDNTLSSDEPGVLVAFADSAASWDGLDEGRDQRRDRLVEQLATLMGERALAPIDYFDRLWAEEPWIRGDVCAFPPGTWVPFGPLLRTPVGPIHWAGTETATEFTGQMEGALRSGERAASEVRERLESS